MTTYTGTHKPTGDGRCEHRWKNRVNRTVSCQYALGFAQATAAARAEVAPPEDRAALWEKWTGGEKLAYGCGYRDARAELGANYVTPLEEAARRVEAVREARAEVARQVRPGVSTADRALNLPHREDEPCACDDCMSYGAEDEGFDWYRIAPARRIVLRVLDSGDDRLAAIATAFREHEAALSEDPPQPEPETDPRVALHKAGGHAGATNRFCSLCNPSAAALLEDAAPRQPCQDCKSLTIHSMEQHDANRAAPRQPEPGEHEINVPLSALAALMEGHERIGNRIDRVEAMATAASQIINAVRTWRDTPGQVKGRSNMRGLAQAEQAILDALSEYEALAAPDTTTETTDE